ncbi:RNA-binding transcriptional accessory protein [bacterium]|nr:MAG: RNA-binding transcriptional accessory protein [bacterium]
MRKTLYQKIAEELSASEAQVRAAAGLLDEGATVPFIARYRKEVTGGLDDTALRTLAERLTYLRELEERREAVIKSVSEQGKLTPELAGDIYEAETKGRLEDLYLPFKPKRRTKGLIAREAGLSPLAEALLGNPLLSPEAETGKYVDPEKGVADVKAVLDGAKYILMEDFAEDADLAGALREYCWQNGLVVSKVIPEKEVAGAKFRDYFEYSEPIAKIPSHRALALFRGFHEGFLSISLELPEKSGASTHPCEGIIAKKFGIRNEGRPADNWLAETVRWTWSVKLHSRIQTDLFGRVREAAEEEAIRVFAENLRALLLAAPAGPKAAMGLDPGLRTGVKVAVVDSTGKVLDHTAVYPHQPYNKEAEAAKILLALAEKHGVEIIAIGNGTAGRETESFVGRMLKARPELKIQKVMVSEAGASVYSASELAAKEFPDLDVTVRGAVSIARRLQDPLAELVKIDPKSIGVGQYQHDVSQVKLARSLDGVVEDCVNAVGVDVNTASAHLLAKISGLSWTLAKNIVEFRDEYGIFKSREQLRSIPRFGEKTFEQAAGFLRVANGDNPLDNSAVHPEAYVVVERMAKKTGKGVDSLIGDAAFLRKLRADDYCDERFGVPTVTDILRELEKPGRDPRPEFRTATFAEGVEELSDLRPGMLLEGTVTNVANFGAFVDIGVHQDGLVHISAISKKFIKDPREAVKVGDIVKVKVLEVDLQRKRIALTMRLDDEVREQNTAGQGGKNQEAGRGEIRKFSADKKEQAPKSSSPFGSLLSEALRKKVK